MGKFYFMHKMVICLKKFVKELWSSLFLWSCFYSKEEYKPRKWGANAKCYTSHKKTTLQRGSPCQDPAGNWTTRRSPDDRKETQTAVVWSCFPFIMSGQNHLARHSEKGKKTRQTEEEVGRQHQGMDRPGVRQVPEGSGEQGKTEKTGCQIICGAPTTLVVKGLMMMMMIKSVVKTIRQHHTPCLRVPVNIWEIVNCVWSCFWKQLPNNAR